MSKHLSLFLLLVILLSLKTTSAQSQTDRDAVSSAVKQHLECWNKRNLDCYLNDYWHSDSLKVLGEEGIVHGYKALSKTLKESYSNQVDMGKLKYDIDSIENLGSGKVMVIGMYHMDRGYDKVSGAFMLVWAKKDGKWVIVIDHSS